jgi:hypothetical protein
MALMQAPDYATRERSSAARPARSGQVPDNVTEFANA